MSPNCAAVHAGLRALLEEIRNFRIGRQTWRSSALTQGAAKPFFQAKLQHIITASDP